MPSTTATTAPARPGHLTRCAEGRSCPLRVLPQRWLRCTITAPDYDWDSDPVGSSRCVPFYAYLLTQLCLLGRRIRSRLEELPTPRPLRSHNHRTIHDCRRAILHYCLSTAGAAPFVPRTISSWTLIDSPTSPSFDKAKQTSEVFSGSKCPQTKARADKVERACP